MTIHLDSRDRRFVHLGADHCRRVPPWHAADIALPLRRIVTATVRQALAFERPAAVYWRRFFWWSADGCLPAPRAIIACGSLTTGRGASVSFASGGGTVTMRPGAMSSELLLALHLGRLLERTPMSVAP